MNDFTRILIVWFVIFATIVLSIVIIIFILNKTIFKNIKDSPLAIPEVLIDNQYVHSGVHPYKDIISNKSLYVLNRLPVWLTHLKDEIPSIYSNVFFGIEPLGEYLYYLAGDYSKNEMGLLNFHSPSIFFKVEVSFEKDVIDAEKNDGKEQQYYAEESNITITDIIDLNVGDIANLYPLEGDATILISLMPSQPLNAKGVSRIVIIRDEELVYFYFKIVYQEFREAQKRGEFERYMEVVAVTTKKSQRFKPLYNHFINLIRQYNPMPYYYLSGASRDPNISRIRNPYKLNEGKKNT